MKKYKIFLICEHGEIAQASFKSKKKAKKKLKKLLKKGKDLYSTYIIKKIQKEQK